MVVELITKTIGVGRYQSLTNEQIIAAVARHGTIKNDNGKLVVYLMDNKHYSPLQHIFFGFRIVTSRAISAQIFRHRSLNFQETSQRYEEINEVEPIQLRRQAEKNRQSSEEVFDPVMISEYLTKDYPEGYFYCPDTTALEEIKYLLDTTQKVYQNLIKKGVAKECARMILPMASQTTIHVSGTLRDLLAFLNIRCEEHTQLEARRIATAMGEELEKELPEILGKIDWRNGLFM